MAKYIHGVSVSEIEKKSSYLSDLKNNENAKNILSKIIIRDDKYWYCFTGNHWVRIRMILDCYIFVCDNVPEWNKEGAMRKNLLTGKMEFVNENDSEIKDHVLYITKHLVPDIVSYDPYILDKFDENDNLIGFLNGVYDIEENIFRQGEKEDMILSPLKIDYKKYTDEELKEMQEIFEKDFFQDNAIKSLHIRILYINTFFRMFQGISKKLSFIFLHSDGCGGPCPMISKYKDFYEKIFGYRIEYIGMNDYRDDCYTHDSNGKYKKFMITSDYFNKGPYTDAVHHPYRHIKCLDMKTDNIIRFPYIPKKGDFGEKDCERLKGKFLYYIFSEFQKVKI